MKRAFREFREFREGFKKFWEWLARVVLARPFRKFFKFLNLPAL